MKHIINYLGALLAVVLIGATFTACSDEDAQSANVGLGIKTFFPTKVVTNQPMTINGSGFNGVTEIEFPGGKKVTDFEIVGNDMIRVNAPSGIAADGGKIIVRTADDEAESHMSLTLGHTYVTGYSKQPGEKATGGELIDVFGSDLEFINSVELLDADGVPQIIDHKEFYRKGTNKLTIRLPKKNIYEGTFVGILHTYDGQSILMPELAYEPGADEGHWETVKTIIWKNDGSLGEINWNGDYRFAPETNSTGEECYTVPMDVWEKMKSETFYVTVKGANPQIRVTTGWWDSDWKVGDIQPGNELLADNGDGTWTLTVNISGDPLVDIMDSHHLLFTGSGYTVEEIYFIELVAGGGGSNETVFWENSGAGAVSWNGTYRFGLEGHDGNNECITTFPQDIWDKIKSGTFYLVVEATDPQIRVTNGWWDTQWLTDFQPGNDLLTDNGDGTWTLEINISGDPLVDTIDEKHILFTGDRFTPVKLYFK